METYELNEVKEIKDENGNWVEIQELYVENENYLIAESHACKYWIPIQGYNEQAGFIGKVYWNEAQKDSEVLRAYK